MTTRGTYSAYVFRPVISVQENISVAISSLKIIPYSKPKVSDFNILSQTKVPKNRTLHGGTYLYAFSRILLV